MSKKNSTLIACVLDRSGSMQAIIDDAVGGFNAFLKSQQEDDSGECKMTVAMFNTQYEIKHSNVLAEEVEEFTNISYCPMGGTALLDAVGKTINSVGKELDDMEEDDKPEKVLFVILTDGLENSSREFTLDVIKNMVKEQQEKWNWEFIYLAADEAGFQAGQQMGFGNNTRFSKDDTRGAYAAMDCAVSHYRASGEVDIDEDIS